SGADTVSVEHLHQAEHPNTISIIARRPRRYVGHWNARSARPWRHLLVEREELDVGDHPKGDTGATRPFERWPTNDGRIRKRTIARRFHSSARLFHGRALCREMGDDLIYVYHVGILVMQVEEIDLVREQTAIKTRFFDEDNMIAMRIGVDCACAHAA